MKAQRQRKITPVTAGRGSALVLVHSDDYEGWRFSETSPTQGRRFTAARDLIATTHAGLFTSGAAIEVEPRPATRDELRLVHDPDYITTVLDRFECGEWSGPQAVLAGLARDFAGGTLVALDHLLYGRTRLAVHLPGAKHHAQRDRSSGFCVFADFAMAARVASDQGYRVAIFDFDAHHGDGTENACRNLPEVLTYSIHQGGIFPFTGTESDAARAVYNVPLWAEDDRDVEADNDALLDAVLDFRDRAESFGADLVFIAAGADGHTDDPLSGLGYTEAGVARAMTALVEGWQVPILVGGAGGYRPDDATPRMWAATVAALIEGGAR